MGLGDVYLAPSTGPDRDVRQLVREALTSSIDKYGDYYKTLRKFHRYYLSANELRRRKEPDRDEGAVNWKAQLFIPYSFSTIETAVPRAVFALFGSRPYVKVVGRTADDEQSAESVEAVLDYDFEQAGVMYKSIQGFKSYYKYGMAIGKATWKRDYYTRTRKGYDRKYKFDPMTGEPVDFELVEVEYTETVARHDGPWLDIVSVFNFFPDPLYSEIEDMRFVLEYERTSRKRLEKLNQAHKALTGEYLYKNLDDVPEIRGAYLTEELPSSAMEETAQVFGYAYDAQARSRNSEAFQRDVVELLHYWENDRYVVLANGQTVIKDGDNPFDDERKPFFAAKCFPVEHEFYALGLMHPTADLQEEMNTWRNIVLDQGKLNLYNVWAGDPTLGLEDADFALYPGKYVEVPFSPSGKPMLSNLLEGRPLPPEAQWVGQQIQRDWQTALAINDYYIGAGTGSAGTASEAAMLNASAATRFRLQALIGEERWIVEMARMFLARRQQFFDPEQIFRIAGKEGYHYKQLTLDEIHGEYDLRPLGTQSQPNKEITRQQLIQVLAVIGQNPYFMQMTNQYELLKQLWNSFDIRFPERFMQPPPEKVWDPQQENIVLLAGEWVPVTMNEPHEEHLQVHMQAIAQVKDLRAEEALMRHIQEHQKYLQQTQAQGSAQEQPGAVRGAPGNVPASPEDTMPGMDRMASTVMGGPGGPIA